MKAPSPFALLAVRLGLGNFLIYWENSPFARFFRWWQSQLLSCLPERWQQALTTSSYERVFYWQDGRLWDSVRSPVLAAMSIDRAPNVKIVLVLPESAVLVRPIVLPNTAALELPAVVAYELDKYMPYVATQVYFDVDNPVAGLSKTLMMNLVVIPRGQLDGIIKSVHSVVHKIHSVDVLDAHGRRMHINLLPNNNSPLQRRPFQRTKNILIGLSLGLVVSVMLLYVRNEEIKLESMRVQVSAMGSEALQIQRLRQKLKSTQNAAQYVSAHKSKNQSVTNLLSELSQCVPANTWLNQLTISAEGEVNLSGQSTQTSALIDEMKSCTSLVGLQFQGTVQSDAVSGKDRFNMLAHLRHKEVNHEATSEAP